MPKGKKRKYLPYRLTKEEKADPKLRKKLASCIKQVEKKACPPSAKRKGKYDYKKCFANPVAVCRASISGKGESNPKKKKDMRWGVFGKDIYGLPEREKARLLIKTYQDFDKALKHATKIDGAIHLTRRRK